MLIFDNVRAAFGRQEILRGVSFRLEPGSLTALIGKNGCGKSTLLKLVLGEPVANGGTLRIGGSLVVSYVPQGTAGLHGSLRALAQREGLDEPLFKAILRKLDFSREQFDKDLETYSEGQKKKVLLAKSLCQPAHLYVWDEPLNFIDVLSRVQIEDLLLASRPTLLFVEHDRAFRERIATKEITL